MQENNVKMQENADRVKSPSALNILHILFRS